MGIAGSAYDSAGCSQRASAHAQLGTAAEALPALLHSKQNACGDAQ